MVQPQPLQSGVRERGQAQVRIARFSARVTDSGTTGTRGAAVPLGGGAVASREHDVRLDVFEAGATESESRPSVLVKAAGAGAALVDLS
eukprot:scaffold669_cov152-Isochrysis_galbana.AAC.7